MFYYIWNGFLLILCLVIPVLLMLASNGAQPTFLSCREMRSRYGTPHKKVQTMSEAIPQDGSTVKGYRTLTPGDIERMNRLKGVSRHFCNLLDTEREGVSAELSETGNHSVEAQEASRCLAIARTKMQEACMWACRAVARPDADC